MMESTIITKISTPSRMEMIREIKVENTATAKREPIVVPVYHEGIDRIFRRGGPRTKSWLRWLPLSLFRRAKVRFGCPVSFGDLRRIEDLKERVAAINQRIVEQIERLKSPPSDSAFA